MIQKGPERTEEMSDQRVAPRAKTAQPAALKLSLTVLALVESLMMLLFD